MGAAPAVAGDRFPKIDRPIGSAGRSLSTGSDRAILPTRAIASVHRVGTSARRHVRAIAWATSAWSGAVDAGVSPAAPRSPESRPVHVAHRLAVQGWRVAQVAGGEGCRFAAATAGTVGR